ncbi:amino acid adenylation domain-containing protein [Nisaea acidiphila]|uniref:Amino acid adenylation domain-containing protein n=1 Tax=Nisaea acidiphila TaxID=1862145 RepID=A0A9J7ALD6_9PROT|nr:non-ribosomal peptide synthetase [Nisaea acidiphila]UUX48467.1 amino acid adenylation domain-containing protein [Nisaea acidiphila]
MVELPRSETHTFPLSLAQQEIWREHALFPGAAVHTVSARSIISGPLDLQLFEESLVWVWERHQALRLTPWVVSDGMDPVLIEVPAPDQILNLHDVSTDPDPEGAAEALAAELGRRAIPLDGGPTFRFDLIRFAPDRHIWVMSYHHINMDAWANGILVRDVAAAYSAHVKGEDSDLPEAPLFEDAVANDADFLESSRYAKAGEYWRELYRTLPDRLVDAVPSVLEGKPPQGTTLCRIGVDGPTMEKLRALAAEKGASTAQLFIAAALILFHKESGATDMVFGMPVLNRPTARDKETFGLFSLTTAPRVQLDPEDGLDAFLGELSRAMRGAMRHHRFPLSGVNRTLGLAAQRVLQLFDLNISYERVEFGELPFGDAVAGVPRVLLNGVERTPVEIFVREYGDGERVEVDLDLSLGAFDPEEAAALSLRYSRVLSWLACGGLGRLSSVPLVDDAERVWLLEGVNATGRDYGGFEPVIRGFERVAAEAPERAALRFEGVELGYGELNARANALARRLLRAGVGKDVRVGVALERSVDLVVALLAVMKAGGAYVPLDPELPADRLAFMIGDAAAPVVVTRTGLLDSLPVHEGRTLCVDDAGRSSRRGAEAGNPDVELGPNDLAYVIYTSGSTGLPKGVMNEHGGLANRILWMQERFDIGEGDKILQKTPYTFDVSVWEFFWPLMCGACLVVAKPGGHKDPDYLARVMAEEGISVLHFVPSMLQAFLGHGGSAARLNQCDALRYVMCSGEALSPGLVERFEALKPQKAELHNLYGPTEAAIDVTHWQCGAPANDPLPIGHAIANTSLYVLDSALEPVPVGVAGDLWIGGVQVSRGYLGRQGLTAETFIADPYSKTPGARMYRTGDIARRRADGALIYLGRSDFQVKLRGFRIELGEIESALMSHGSIREAAVLLREDRQGDPRLVGYLVAEGNTIPADLGPSLRARLPEHMVPSDWVTLEALPITANGKLDRKALPAPELTAAGLGGRPRGPEEEVCCAVLAGVLGREEVGAEDNFFALGGHSLLAVQVVGRLRKALGVDLPANAVFAHPTARDLAKHVRDAKQTAKVTRIRRDPLAARPASSAEARLWVLQQRDPDDTAYNMTGAIDIHGELDPDAMARGLAAVQHRHPLLHSLFRETDGRLEVVPHSEMVERPAVEAVAGDAAASQIEKAETGTPFHLGAELPFRARILDLGGDRWRVLIAFHHIAADAESIALFGQDLETAYREAKAAPALDAAALAERLPAPGLDPLAAEEGLEFGPDGEGSAALGRWKERLSGLSGGPALPRAAAAASDEPVLVEKLFLEPSLQRRIAARARDAGLTPFMLLHTALAVALHRFGGGEDVVIGTPVSQRADGEFARTIGMMLNSAPLRLSLEGEETLAALAAAARDVLIAALADGGVPLDRIAAECTGENGEDLFQVLLTTHPPHLDTLQLGAAEVGVRVLPQARAKMDLVVLAADDGAAMELSIEHAAGLFPRGGAARFAEALERILETLADRPETPVGQVALFAPGSSERAREVTGAEIVDARGAPDGTVVSRFAEMAAVHGSLPALEGPDGIALTYAELDRRTDELAAGLAAHGVGRGTPVGVSMARGTEQIALFLAVLKAGGAYVPLDPEQPGPRLADMAADAGIALVVTGGTEADWLPAGIEAVASGALAIEGGRAGCPATLGADAAYIMFTSGSTGRPKGIRVPHRAVLRLAIEPGFAAFGPGKRVAQIATTAFDAATYEIWCALLNGATTVVVGREATYEAEALADAFATARTHSTFLTASVFNRAAFAEADAFSGFEEVMFGGEAADPDAVCAAAKRWPGVRFVNGYGPTETTTFAATHFSNDESDGAKIIPIGSPIRGTALYILDAHLEPVPRGVAGELYIGGIGLADGYVARPGQTAEVFLADPFSAERGARMYRTGDLVRRRADGAVEYLGRVDRQIKLRGFRIEPGEIEAALREVSGSEQAVADVRETDGDRALYGWVVGPDGEEARRWREALAERLPGWMVPRRIAVLEALPLTPNGKLDRGALPLPEGGDAEEARPVSYATETEEALAGLWADLLGGGAFRPQDGFFSVGGHSLLGVRLTARIRARFGADLPLKTVFAKPRLADMAAEIEALAGQSGDLPVARDWTDEVRPASAMQRRLALMDSIDGSGIAYTVPIVTLFEGVPDIARLETALRKLLERHEPLRTAVRIGESIDGVLLPAGGLVLRHEKLAALDTVEAREFAEQMTRGLAQEPFALATDLPLRASLLDFGGERSALVLVAHHNAVDGHSVPALLRDLAALYDGDTDALPPLPFRYGDWVTWREGGDRAKRDEAALARAKEMLAGAPPLLDLPTDYQRPAERSHMGGVSSFAIAPALENAVREKAKTLSTTPFALMVAAYAVLLARTAGTDDLVLGVPFDGREISEADALVGFFADTAAIRVTLDDDPDPATLIARVQAELARALSEPAPLDRLIEAMDLKRDTSRTPLFQAMIAYNEEAQPRLSIGGLDARPLAVHPGTAKFDLQLQILREEDGLTGALEYASDLFTDETAEALSLRYSRVLSWLACGGLGRLSSVPLVDDAERVWLLEGVNATGRDYGGFEPVIRGFERVAAEAPERAALRFEGVELGYGELNARANALARRLLRAGVGKDVRVGVALERSVDLVVALLAVMKAGGAYVPLDPELPADRLAFMIGDAAAPVVVTRTGLLDSLPVHEGRTLCVDDAGRSSRRGAEAGNPDVELGPNDLAYVIYTSGSTGLPKGVMNEHGGLANRILWMQERFDIGEGDKILQKTPYTFDVSVWEFFWPLMCGACLVVAKPGGHKDPDYLARVMAEEGISVLHFVPSMLQAFLGHGGSAARLNQCDALRYVMCSGEALSPGLVERFEALKPQKAELHNLYGPTEAAIDVTHWQCGAPANDPLPIGHAIANTSLYVLDSALEPVPVGVAGDLWIGGVQVSRGYLGRQGLTAETFIADPYSKTPGARMYRTGDIARRRADGALIYLGRSDFQVKLRGFRIELGEIESALMSHGSIREAAVLLREDRQGDPRLVGYLVAEGNTIPADLGPSLRARLPEHMVPSDWVTLEALPITANGKLDRKALPAPELTAAGLGGRPRGPEEEVCCAVLAGVLGREEVGAEDNFFALGGHSLLAVQVVGRLRKALGVDLPANAVFAHPTARLLAKHVREKKGADAQPIAKTDRESVLPSLGQEQLWFLSSLEGSNAYNVPDGFVIDGPLDLAALSGAVSDIVARHEALRTLLVEEEGRLVAKVLPPAPVAVPLEKLESGDEVAIRAWFEAKGLQSFDLDCDIPVRAAVGALPDGRHLLALVMHHSATDGGSAPVVYRDLTMAYHARCRGRALALPPLAIEYYDWAAWQRERMSTPETAANVETVAERLAGAPETLDLPEDFQRADPQAFEGSMLHLPVPQKLAKGLRDKARDKQATLFMLLLAGLGVTLQRLSGESDIVVGAPASGRDRGEVQDLVGYFVNTVPLRLRLEDAGTLDAAIEIARREVLEGFTYQDLPMDRVVQALGPDRAAGRTPLFRVMLVLQPADRMALALDGATVTPVHVDAVSARYDLTFAFDDLGDGLGLVVHYAADLFSEATARRFARYYEKVLADLIGEPETDLAAVSLFAGGSSERRAEISGAEIVDARGAPEGTITSHFAAMVGAHGGLAALEGPDGVALTYTELDRRTDELAAGLAARGVGRGTPVGISMPRGPVQIALFLAVLKAGGAYVPLDPDQPGPRITEMARDAGVSLVVTDALGKADWLPDGVQEVDCDTLAVEGGRVDCPATLGADSAYIMFTSGSTGRPKGIRVPHRAVLRLAVEPGYAAFAPGKRVAQIATTAFDAATYEIWGALLNGGTCAVVGREATYDADALARALKQAKPHSMFLTTAVFNRAAASDADVFAGVEELFFGGERVDPAAVRTALKRWPQLRISHVYGPTETTTFASHHPLKEVQEGAGNVPIGGPIRDTALYVLDRNLEPVPRGVAGELYIGGTGLADGYVGHPGQTAEVFLADPYADEPGARMYRTGDLVRRRPDGAIEYLGRIDRQIKLRGFRIEPGEIEAALREVSGAEHAVVDVRETDGDRALFGWVASPDGAFPDSTAQRHWREALAEKLPGWMVPRRIALLEALPLTPNGKIDMRALTNPEATDAETESGPVVYATDTERELAALWAALLGGGSFRPDDGFFNVGGHSLLGVRLVAGIRERFGVALSLRTVFEQPGLRAMARAVDALRLSTDDTAAESAESGPITRRARRSGKSRGVELT